MALAENICLCQYISKYLAVIKLLYTFFEFQTYEAYEYIPRSVIILNLAISWVCCHLQLVSNRPGCTLQDFVHVLPTTVRYLNQMTVSQRLLLWFCSEPL